MCLLSCLVKQMQLWFSSCRMVGTSCLYSNSFKKEHTQTEDLTATARRVSSDSAEESATDFCVLDFQTIAPPNSLYDRSNVWSCTVWNVNKWAYKFSVRILLHWLTSVSEEGALSLLSFPFATLRAYIGSWRLSGSSTKRQIFSCVGSASIRVSLYTADSELFGKLPMLESAVQTGLIGKVALVAIPPIALVANAVYTVPMSLRRWESLP